MDAQMFSSCISNVPGKEILAHFPPYASKLSPKLPIDRFRNFQYFQRRREHPERPAFVLPADRLIKVP